MNEDTAARQESPSRVINVFVPGDTVDEIELAALDEARAFFGADRKLEIVRNYEVHAVSPGSRLAESGKKYSAALKVRAIES